MGILSKLASKSIQPSILFKPNENYLIKICHRSFRQKKPVRKDGRMNLAPDRFTDTPRENNLLPGLFKSYMFTFGFCGVVFSGATLFEYERYRKNYESNSIINWANDKWNEIGGYKEKQGEFRQELNKLWNKLSAGEKLFWPLCGINVLVLGCWHHPNLQRVMLKYFCNNPAAKAVCWPLTLSTFSHYSVIHFGMNMYVLYGFCSVACSKLGPEQLSALYLSGGVISSLCSSSYKVLIRSVGPSIGASGAIMCLLGYFCSQFPEAKLGIVFIPNFNFTADTAIKSIICLDFAGMLFRWKLFDHAAHLGGALFGIFYAYYGKYIWDKRAPLMEEWHNFRNRIGSKAK